jgi:S-disulfanyl-L-cysteine oxidoreductase SoxD
MMRVRLPVMTMAGAAALALALVPLRAQGGKTTWDGVYSQAQAEKGSTLFTDRCAKCHGPDGAGADAPALAGSEFGLDWDGLTVSQLFERVSTTMPQDNPQSLSREEVASILAFLFQRNGFPAGSTDLTQDAAGLVQIKYLARKPAAN